MAVYTTLTRPELESLLRDFNLPALHSFQGSASGIENTTYFLSLQSGENYVLTVFETHTANSLQPYIELLILLASHKLPVPNPCIDKNGVALQVIADKPALLFPRSLGHHIITPTPATCHMVGHALARIHTLTSTLPVGFPVINNLFDLAWMKDALALVTSSLSATDIKLLQDQYSLATDLASRGLPQGIIHGDLFRDNVLIDRDKITAVIDFYHAGRDMLLMDLAIMANDWCYTQDTDQKIDSCVDALLGGYQEQKPLLAIELTSWRECLRVAATRLWLSRQKRLVLSRAGHKGAVKDPDEYKLLLLQHCNRP